MPRIATVALRDLLGPELMAGLARILAQQQTPLGEVAPVCEPVVHDPELEPFQDWDAVRGRGAGFFRSDADECASRRVDLRGPTDVDPGPLPMDEAPEDEQAERLQF
jgi:hypothetical protein